MGAYFARMKDIAETHGGTVEKFIGDAVMVVFGVPRLHEDDAERAVRAALAMRDAVADLNRDRESRSRSGSGVNSGEVVAGVGDERQFLVTGDAVNVAARLQAGSGGRRGRRRRAHRTPHPRRDRIRGARADHREGQGRAGAGVPRIAGAQRPSGPARGLADAARRVRRPRRELRQLLDTFARASDERTSSSGDGRRERRRRQVPARRGSLGSSDGTAPTCTSCAVAACRTARGSRTGRSWTSCARTPASGVLG